MSDQVNDNIEVNTAKRLLALPNVPYDCRPGGCVGCPNKGVKVGSRGPVDSPFVIVGESPGSTELHRGLPFVGPSGVMLEDTLKEAGWVKGVDPDPYITNAMQCYPGQDKTPTTMKGMVAPCQTRLHEELAAYPRKVILCLGNAASWGVTGNYGLRSTQDRGRRFDVPGLSEMGAVVTVHPAFLMRSSGEYMFPKWKEDLRYAIDLLHGNDSKAGWRPPVWGVVEDRDAYEAALGRLRDANHIAGDIETSGLDFQRNYILCLVVTSDRSNGRYVDVIPGDVLWANEDLTHELLGLKAKWIWQNGKFDCKFFRFEGIHEARVDEDTMLESYALDEHKGHDLDTIAWDNIGAPKHKNVLDQYLGHLKKKDRSYAVIPKPVLYQYAAYDVSKTYSMHFALQERLNQDVRLKRLYYDLLIPGTELLLHVEMKGMELNAEKVEQNIRELEIARDAANEEIQKWARQYGQEINPGSWQQLQVLLWNKMKLAPPGTKTNEDALIQAERRHPHEIYIHLRQWKKLNKLLTTYARPAMKWVGVDEAVHTTYKLHGTTTGRLASGEPTNMQNMPRDADQGSGIPETVSIRAQFRARKGRVLIEVDLNQAELRSLALMSNDPTLVHIYTDPNAPSIHHVTSVKFFGENYTYNQKMRGKAVNFGIVYGRTAPSIASDFGIPIKEAQIYLDTWGSTYPVAWKFIERCRLAAQRGETIVTAFGRKRRWGVVSWDNLKDLQNQAANFPHQSTAGDICTKAAIVARPVLKQRWDADIVNLVHDAIYIEIEDDPLVYCQAIAYLKAVMQQVPKDYGLVRIPFLAEAKVGRVWGGGEMHDFNEQEWYKKYVPGYPAMEDML